MFRIIIKKLIMITQTIIINRINIMIMVMDKDNIMIMVMDKETIMKLEMNQLIMKIKL